MLPAILLLACASGGWVTAAEGRSFKRIATFPVCKQYEPNCNTDLETVAEIVVASDDGHTLVYTDAANGGVGFVDITNPGAPAGLGLLSLGGEVTSVGMAHSNYAVASVNTSPDYVSTSGALKVIDMATKSVVHSIDLGGQPDAVAISPDRRYAAVAIENERDEDLGDGGLPQQPAGFLVVLDISGAEPAQWVRHTVSLTGLPGIGEPADPEPEFVSINADNVAVVTLQENNGLVLVDLESRTVTRSVSAGSVDLHHVDTVEDSQIKLDAEKLRVPREPDGVTWMGTGHFATADEGDMDGGSRGFTIYDASGAVVWTSGNALDHLAARMGHYPDERSENKGAEPENVAFGEFGGRKMLFVNAERASLVFVYDVDDPASPKYLQALPVGVGPEGTVVIPGRNLVVVASEADSRGDKFRASLAVFEYGEGAPEYPTLSSASRFDGTPIPWGALSGLAAGSCERGHTLYAVEDSFYKKNRVFAIDAAARPARLVQEIRVVDAKDVLASLPPSGEFDAADLSALINDDRTVNLDLEGIAATEEGFWVVSEGRGTVGDEGRPVESLNLLLRLDPDGVIEEVVALDEEVNAIQLRYGFEGVAVDGDHVVVAFQRPWAGESHPRLGIYSTAGKSWKFVFYPLDAPGSQNGGWVGLGDISALGGGRFLVLERDNQSGPDASVKKIYEIDLGDLGGLTPGSTVHKEPLVDLVPALRGGGGPVAEKVEGLAVTCDGSVWVVNDNDGTDDSSGETRLLDLGGLATTSSTMTCARAKEAYRRSECCGNPGRRFRW